MSKLSDFILHILFPNKCMFCNKVLPYDIDICDECLKDVPLNKTKVYCNNKYFDYFFSPFYYKYGVKTAIKDLKFYGIKSNSKKLAYYMSLLIMDAPIDIIVAVPMYKENERLRGFNQSKLLAKEISKLIGVPYDFSIIKKIKSTKNQHDLSKSERLKNLSGCFKCNNKCENLNVLIVDDVFTTGSTIDCCSLELKKVGAKTIFAITAAYTE
ncbi:MAG: ComF family protein [Oscillospiraceae bacterium]